MSTSLVLNKAGSVRSVWDLGQVFRKKLKGDKGTRTSHSRSVES
jgi:hypothetical protein